MKTFLEQSNGTEKNPKKKYLDGFGFAWMKPEKIWDVYKKAESYEEVMKNKKVQEKMNEIYSKDVVVGHIRKKEFGNVSLENTQPFIYENQIFCHNGRIDSFVKIKSKIKERIDPIYTPIIKGETDSEYLFYLFLTFKKKVESENLNDFTSFQHASSLNLSKKYKFVLETAMNQMIDFLKGLENPDVIYLNIIYCNDEFSIITRYVICKNETDKKAPTLYYNNTDGVIISSEPIIKTGSKLVQENSFLIIKL
jgi:predicted glutamine amidotransferase